MNASPRRRRALSAAARVRLPFACVAAVGVIAASTALARQDPAAPRPNDGELRVTILHTSDEHSAVLPMPLVEYRPGGSGSARGGFARLAQVVEDVRRRKAQLGEPVLLTSAGDHTGGSPFSWLVLDGEAPELALMVEMGYDVITLGNHEFDHGPERLAGAVAAAGFPLVANRTAIVASNTRPPAGHPLTERGLRRSHMLTLPNGLRVGFIGLIGRSAVRVAPSARPVEFDDAAEAAAAAVTELRAGGAHIIIALTHSGLSEDRALASAVEGIDVILGGHDHRLLEEPVVEAGTIIVHPGAYLRQVVMLELGWDPATAEVRLRNPESAAPFVIPLDGTVEESPAVAARIAGYRRQLEEWMAELTDGRFSALDATIARSTFTIRRASGAVESPFGNFVADAMRAAAERATGERVDFAFQANGSIRGDVAPGADSANRDVITVHDLAGLVGLGSGPDGRPGYPLVSLWLTGDEVRRVLEVSILLSELLGNAWFLQTSGVRTRYDPRRAVLMRVPLRGTPIPTGRAVLSAERDEGGTFVPLERGDSRLYHVVTDHYVLSFLPPVGRLVPRLAVVPKAANGEPIDDVDQTIIRRRGEELKVWQAVLEFAADQPRNDAGEARIPEYYAATAGRLVVVRATPIWLWAIAGLALVAVPVVAGVVLWRWRAS
ncbi:MAG TPA: bifunctional UDP-sugar hydrolase/5'-nucleotidase [Gemmatimonadaceae bacterium]|nr:bifunctional UDP-sugar hydrolase/5'-nucleotidase [Gemmatimonadaceae bacterium]